MARIVGEVRPRYIFVENSPMLVHRGLAVVLADIAALGYDAQWGVVGAEHAIAYSGDRCSDHERERLWIIASLADADRERKLQQKRSQQNQRKRVGNRCEGVLKRGNWSSEPDVGRMAHGVARRANRLKAIGNGQVPAVAALAWNLLK